MKRAALHTVAWIILFLILPAGRLNGQCTKAGIGLVLKNPNEFHDERNGFLGVNLRGIYELSLPFHLCAGFTYVIPNTYKETVPSLYKWSNSLYMFDVNAHYIFNELDRFEFYGLGGVNVSIFRYHWVSEFDNFRETGGNTNVYPGLNLGAGSYMRFNDQIDFFADAKIILASKIQFVITGGILVNLQWFAKHDE